MTDPRSAQQSLALDGIMRERVTLLGIPVDPFSMDEVVDVFRTAIKTRTRAIVFNVNVDSCMHLRRDPMLRGMYRGATLVLVDGTPLTWAARILGVGLPGRVSGSDFLLHFCRVAAEESYTLFLLGAGPGVADRAKAALEARYPGLRIVGTYSPPFGFDADPVEDEKAVRIVRAASPDVLFVGLGFPKQERWITRHRDALRVPVAMGVGSSLDYPAGRLRRAPPLVQAAGLEWVFRLVQEPDRLWKRYLLNDSPFVFHVAAEWVRQQVARGGARGGGGHMPTVTPPGPPDERSK